MSLVNYGLYGPSTVIQDDDRDPHVSWANHLKRTSNLRGGVDLVALTPQPVYAPTDGIMDWRKNDGSAGNSCRFWHKQNAGWSDVFSHLSTYVGVDMQEFKRGDLIAHTGATGGVTPHLHRHLLNPSGVRCNPWDFFSAATAGLDQTVIEDDDMKLSDLVEVDDGKGGKQQVYYGMLLNHFFVHINRAANNAEAAANQSRDMPFNSTAMKDAAGNPAPVTMGILADHTRVIIGGVDEKLAALQTSIAKLSVPSVGGAQIDYKALAKAVNDDAHARMEN